MSDGTLGAVIRKARYILREEGLSVFLDRLARAGIVRVRRKFRDHGPNVSRWEELQGRYAGQRAFLLGNGPSLNRTPLHLLQGEHTMCFNRFNLMFERLSWRPSMYAVIDDRVLVDMAPEMGTVLDEVKYAFFPDLHPYNIDFTRLLPARENVRWIYPDRLTFSDDLPWCGINKTVANVGLQILAYLGFSPIYLVGVDATYKTQSSAEHESSRDMSATADDDPNHFDPRYFGAGRRYHHPRMDETLEKFGEARAFFSARGVTIMNAGVGGALEVFPRVDFRSLFSVDPARELALLLKPTDVRPVDGDLGRSLPEAITVAAGAAWPEEASAVITTADDGFARIHSVIFDYVPFGPFQGQYLFVRRNGRSGK